MLKEIVDMDECVKCLAFEVPGEVWRDVNAIWKRLRVKLCPMNDIDLRNLVIGECNNLKVEKDAACVKEK